MMNRETLREYLSHEYQGWESFLSNIIFPIFGEEDFNREYGAELLKSQPERKRLAEATGISSVKMVGSLYFAVEPLQIFDVTVSDRVAMERNRVNIQRLIRSVMEQYSCAFMLFHYEQQTSWDWRFSYCHKGGNEEETTDSKRYTFLLGPGQSCRTAADNFWALYEKQGELEIKDIENAFNVEALSKEFFSKYKQHYEAFVSYIADPANGIRQNFLDTDFDRTGMTADKASDREEKPIRDYVKKLHGRIVFLHFLQKKGWLGVPKDKEWGNGDRDFMLHLFQNATEKQKANFLDDVLEPLFSNALDYNRASSGDVFDTGVKGITKVRIPYLNGGLFERDELDKKTCRLPACLFSELLTMLSQYNFTIDENDPNDAEVGVDPEMLGRIFENLLEDNKEKGAYYTPKEIVQYMCRESLIAYLQTDHNEEEKERIRRFVTTHDAEPLGELAPEIDKKLQYVKICDPAIGSGAFPMGLLRELFFCRCALNPSLTSDAAKVKRHIIENNIYGVDIDRGAVDIARLRFWLSLIVDEKEPITLPNLDFKIMQGNSLLEQYKGVDLSKLTHRKTEDVEIKNRQLIIYDDELDLVRNNLYVLMQKYYGCDDHIKRKELRKSITELVKQQLKIDQLNVSIDDIDIHATEQFFLWHTWFNDVFSRQGKEGFDIIIGNPPYISTKGVKDVDKRLYEREFGFSDDTYNLFTFRGLSLCREGGTLTFIIPKTFWTTQTKRNMRELMLKNTIEYIFDTANPFEVAMVDTCIIQIRKSPAQPDHKVRFLDGTESLLNPKSFEPISQSLYANAQNAVIFRPTGLNLRIYELYNDKVKALYEKWWEKIKTSRDIEKNKKELDEYRANLKPGDVALLGCLTEGGQGLATANNGKYIAVRSLTKWADNIRQSRPKKLEDAIKRHKIVIPELAAYPSVKDFLAATSEEEIAKLFDSLKEEYGRDIFGQGYLYKIITDDEIANVDELTTDEKENGIDISKKYYVPYDKGDKDGNRWYLETPFAIAWSRENVQFLKTDPRARYQGYTFFFREGLCWSDINTVLLKCRKKTKSINDVKSMSVYSVSDLASEDYIMSLINSKFISCYVNDFINNTQTFQINDARQLPILIPTNNEAECLQRIARESIAIKKRSFTTDDKDLGRERLTVLQNELNRKVLRLYHI